jgi:hypothetical protein
MSPMTNLLSITITPILVILTLYLPRRSGEAANVTADSHLAVCRPFTGFIPSPREEKSRGMFRLSAYSRTPRTASVKL